jgi:hypothetical protein
MKNMKTGMIAYAWNAACRRLRQEDHEFKASLGYTVSSRPFWGYMVTPCLKKQKRKKW